MAPVRTHWVIAHHAESKLAGMGWIPDARPVMTDNPRTQASSSRRQIRCARSVSGPGMFTRTVMQHLDSVEQTVLQRTDAQADAAPLIDGKLPMACPRSKMRRSSYSRRPFSTPFRTTSSVLEVRPAADKSGVAQNRSAYITGRSPGPEGCMIIEHFTSSTID